jgi:hypothetical protein
MILNPGFFKFSGRNPTQAEWVAAITEYLTHEERGLTPNQIAPLMGITPGSVCRLRLLSREARR